MNITKDLETEQWKPVDTLSLKEIDDILKVRYPARHELLKFPMGEKLEKLDRMIWTSEMRCIELNLYETAEETVYGVIKESTSPGASPEKRKSLNENITRKLIDAKRMSSSETITDVFRTHIEQCMEGMRCLTGDDEYTKFFEFPKAGEILYANLQDKMEGFSFFEKQFLRIVILYHDIGKVIHRDKHPMLGQHLLESLSDADRKKFVDIFAQGEMKEYQSEKWFYSMLDIVGHHNLFGTLCTGEASKTAIIEASGLHLREIMDAVKIIDLIAAVNLADIYGSIGKLPVERVKMILHDWNSFQSAIDSINPVHLIISQPSSVKEQKLIISKTSLENKLIETEQEPEKTIERVRRIVRSGIIYGRDEFGLDNKIFNKQSRSKLANKISADIIRSALVKELGPELQRFCHDFALVCKLDYTLRFIVELCNRWIVDNYEKILDDRDYRIDTPVTIVLDVLIRLVRCYSDLTYKNEGGQRRIGLELLDLTRSKEISNKVIELLLDKDRKSEGINWIADETTAWYYV